MSRGDVYLSEKESRRVYVMERLMEGVVTVKEASCVLGLSERQIKRLKAGVKERGIAALAHGNRGRKPKHATPKEVKEAIVGFAVGKYHGASYQHMSELMKEHDGIFVSAKTVGRILKEASIPNKHTHKAPRRRRTRNRMSMEGMLVQCDASPHDWLEGRCSKLCLHGAIDDATGKVFGLYFRPNEDLLGYLHVLKQMVEDYGVPRSIYSDGHSIFFSPKGDKLSIEEELKGERVKLTQFGEVLNQLGITHIKARSPQAKGRIERLWETLQSRLIVELRIANISSMDDANDFLCGFKKRFNGRFAVKAEDKEQAFRASPGVDSLHKIICIKSYRKASNGSTISYEGNTYQLLDCRGRVVPLKPKSTVCVTRHLDGSLGALYSGDYFKLKAISNDTDKKAIQGEDIENKAKPRGKYKPPTDHPWRRSINNTIRYYKNKKSYPMNDELRETYTP
jgi:transposase